MERTKSLMAVEMMVKNVKCVKRWVVEVTLTLCIVCCEWNL